MIKKTENSTLVLETFLIPFFFQKKLSSANSRFGKEVDAISAMFFFFSIILLISLKYLELVG